MRRVIQVYIVAILALCSITLSAWKVSWFDWEDLIPGQRSKVSDLQLGPAKGFEIVVFGGSWSDSAVFHQHTPSATHPHSNGTLSKGWTESLCDRLDCRYRNYANSRSRNATKDSGALVESGLFTQTNFEQTQLSDAPSDLKAQIRQWSSDNARSQVVIPQIESTSQIIYVLDFGLWDIWNIASPNTQDGDYIVRTSVDIIFASLDYLDNRHMNSSSSAQDLKAILPFVVDMTFLPGYSKDVETEKKTVDLVKLWNDKLTERAKNWGKGNLFLYDMNNFMVEQIRKRQMIAVNAVHDKRDNETAPTFANVATSCLQDARNATATDDSSDVLCASPDDFLFWDDFHLGPKAHHLIAQEMFRDMSNEAGWL